MKLQGSIREIRETKEYGAKGFKKRELILTTSGEYPQFILIEFVQDKCAVLDSYQVDDEVEISINIRGNQWTNKEGKEVYFNSLQAWRIEKTNNVETSQAANQAANDINGNTPY